METVALHAQLRKAARDRKQPGDPRHRAVKRRVEARHLGQPRMTAAERLYQPDLLRQVVGVIGRDAAQFRQEPRRDPLRLGMPHAVDHAVARGLDRPEGRLRLEPVDQEIHGLAAVGCAKAGDPRLSIGTTGSQARAARTDAVDLPG